MRFHPYRMEWSWNTEVEKYITSLVNGKGKSVHLCSGRSKIGDIRVDLCDAEKECKKQKRAIRGTRNIISDVIFLPFKDSVADTVLSDPPYIGGEYMKFVNSLKYEMLRILKPGGRFIWYSFDIPYHKHLSLDQLHINPNQHQPYHRILSVSTKKQTGLESFIV